MIKYKGFVMMSVTMLTDLVFLGIGFSLGLLVSNFRVVVPFVLRAVFNWLLRLVGINRQLNRENKWYKINQQH